MRFTTLFVFLAGSALAQNSPAPTFEVASVKINQQYRQDDVRTWEQKLNTSPGNLTMRNVSMVRILKWAYHVSRYQIAGPDWLEIRRPGMNPIDSDRYDILAKASGAAGDDEMRPMLQTLLAERFHLALHRESRTIPVFALVEVKGGHKMRVSQSEGPSESTDDPKAGRVNRRISMAELADDLSDSRDFNVAVIDATGLKGRFDFEANVKKYVPQLKPGDPPPDVLAIVQEMLEKELGLKLESRKAKVEVLVIDRLEKSPIEN